MMDSRYLDYISEAIKHLYPITKQHIEGILNDLKTYITDRLDVNVNQLPNIKTPNIIFHITKDDWSMNVAISLRDISAIYDNLYSTEEVGYSIVKQIKNKYVEDTLCK